MISEVRFYNGFLAALRQQGITVVDTRNDIHHAKFAHAVDALKAARAKGDPGAKGMPRTISSSVYTGRFKRLDDALLRAQSGGRVASPNPQYVVAEITMSVARAAQTLEHFDAPERALLVKLAQVFAGEELAGNEVNSTQLFA